MTHPFNPAYVPEMFYGNKFLGIMQLEFNYFVEYEKSK
jgi:hypothetical protein